MRIGIDLDGVVFDSETTFRVYEEIFDISKGQNKLIDRSEPKYQSRYNWSLDEQNEFSKCYLEVSQNSPIMPGFLKVYELLRKYDIEFVCITARGITPTGDFVQYMEDDARRLLDENNIKFDKYYWKQGDKLEVCLKENLDYMIDDDHKIITKLADKGIKTIYFRDTNLKKLEENEYIKEVNNWGDIYRYLLSKLEVK